MTEIKNERVTYIEIICLGLWNLIGEKFETLTNKCTLSIYPLNSLILFGPMATPFTVSRYIV